VTLEQQVGANIRSKIREFNLMIREAAEHGFMVRLGIVSTAMPAPLDDHTTETVIAAAVIRAHARD
jgi:hypothetical protein